MIAFGIVAVRAQPVESAQPLLPLGDARERLELPPLTADARLDALALRYAREAVAARCLCLATTSGGQPEDQLLADVIAALGAVEVRAGVVIGWDGSVERAVAAALGRPAQAGALLDAELSLVGVGSVVVPPGEPWLEPAPSGEGPPIELTGYQLVVIVTAGYPR